MSPSPSRVPAIEQIDGTFDQLLVADCQQAVPLEVLDKVIVDRILIQILSFDQELCVIPKFQHKHFPF